MTFRESLGIAIAGDEIEFVRSGARTQLWPTDLTLPLRWKNTEIVWITQGLLSEEVRLIHKLTKEQAIAKVVQSSAAYWAAPIGENGNEFEAWKAAVMAWRETK